MFEDLVATLQLLSEDYTNYRLKSHKLKGKLDCSWACSVGYNTRIVFSLITHQGQEAILLESIGTHDEGY